MDRIEMAKKFYRQAQKMTLGMAILVVVYGAMGYYLIRIGKAGPSILNAQTYPLVKYGALTVSVLGIFAMKQLSHRMLSSFPATVRPPQKLLGRTILMNAGAQLSILLGLALIFFGRQPYDYIPFAVISLAGFALAFPKKEQWVSWLGTNF